MTIIKPNKDIMFDDWNGDADARKNRLLHQDMVLTSLKWTRLNDNLEHRLLTNTPCQINHCYHFCTHEPARQMSPISKVGLKCETNVNETAATWYWELILYDDEFYNQFGLATSAASLTSQQTPIGDDLFGGKDGQSWVMDRAGRMSWGGKQYFPSSMGFFDLLDKHQSGPIKIGIEFNSGNGQLRFHHLGQVSTFVSPVPVLEKGERIPLYPVLAYRLPTSWLDDRKVFGFGMALRSMPTLEDVAIRALVLGKGPLLGCDTVPSLMKDVLHHKLMPLLDCHHSYFCCFKNYVGDNFFV